MAHRFPTTIGARPRVIASARKAPIAGDAFGACGAATDPAPEPPVLALPREASGPGGPCPREVRARLTRAPSALSAGPAWGSEPIQASVKTAAARPRSPGSPPAVIGRLANPPTTLASADASSGAENAMWLLVPPEVHVARTATWTAITANPTPR